MLTCLVWNWRTILEVLTLIQYVLVGSDYYWEFMTGETLQGTDGPVAVHSTLGWLLSGSTDSTHGGVNTCAHFILTNEPNCIPKSKIQYKKFFGNFGKPNQ